MSKASSRIFISYSHQDAVAAGQLAALLSAADYEVWMDRNLIAGEEYRSAIEERLTAADAVIVIWSKHATASPWVMDEASHAVSRGVLVSIRLDQAPLPLGFGSFHALTFGESIKETSEAWPQLLTAIRRVASRGGGHPGGDSTGLARGAIAMVVAFGTPMGVSLWALYRRSVSESIVGHPVLDALAIGYIVSGVMVLSCAGQAYCTGIRTNSYLWWLLVRSGKAGAPLALLVVMAASVGGLGHEKSTPEVIGALFRLFWLLFVVATCIVALIRAIIVCVASKSRRSLEGMKQ